MRRGRWAASWAASWVTSWVLGVVMGGPGCSWGRLDIPEVPGSSWELLEDLGKSWAFMGALWVSWELQEVLSVHGASWGPRREPRQKFMT